MGTQEVLCSTRSVTNHGSGQNSGLDRRSRDYMVFMCSYGIGLHTKPVSKRTHFHNVHLIEVLTFALSDVSRKIELAEDI